MYFTVLLEAWSNAISLCALLKGPLLPSPLLRLSPVSLCTLMAALSSSLACASSSSSMPTNGTMMCGNTSTPSLITVAAASKMAVA